MNSKTMKSIRSQRSIHLIDIENLCGASNPTIEQVKSVKEEYENLVQPGDQDLFYVTVSSKNNLEAAMFGWPGVRLACLEGHDGADILLALEMLKGNLSESFNKVFLGSGDGGLAPYADLLVRDGADVSVISLSRSLSRQLERVGAELKYIKETFRLAA